MMLTVALKEWAVICDLLAEGRCPLLLRKGGIHEEGGPGRFALEHERFTFFPAWEHQWPEGVKPAFRERVETFDREPSEVTFHAMGVVTGATIWRLPTDAKGVADRAVFDRLEDLHPWSAAQIDVRFHYKPERPLYVVAPRVYRLAMPKTIANDASYQGCRSWVPLRAGDEPSDAGATPVVSDEAFGTLCERIARTVG